MINVGVYGATGYAGYELVQILLRHPAVRLAFATSEQSAGGCLGDSYACPDDVPLVRAEDAPLSEVDCVFCSLPHGASMGTVRAAPAGKRVIDLSADFRLADRATYERWYKVTTRRPSCWPGGLRPASCIATRSRRQPGGQPRLLPTSVILGGIPNAGLLAGGHVIADCKSVSPVRAVGSN